MHPWGWATWKRSWDLLNLNTKYLLRKMRFKVKKFNLGGNCGSYGNLYCQKVGLVDSWYIRFYASLFLNKKLNLFPKQAMVINGGLDDSGTHCGTGWAEKYSFESSHIPIILKNIPVVESMEAYGKFKRFYDNSCDSTSLVSKLERLKSFLRRLFYIDCM